MNEATLTVLIPTSPIPSHPSTEIISKCVASIQKQLPGVPIIILCDGVRDGLSHRTGQYNRYLCALIYQCNHEWKGVSFRLAHEHKHQAGMVKAVLPEIHTPLIFFCEHDAIIDDKPIDWNAIEELLLSGEAHTVRLYWHESIHPEHQHLMGNRIAPFVKTTQWSSWPHLSRTDFYRKIMEEHFAGKDKVMIETVMYSPVLTHPWESYRTYIYAPRPDAVRFHHLDGRVDRETGDKDPCDW
jgi:hypothetical protein